MKGQQQQQQQFAGKGRETSLLNQMCRFLLEKWENKSIV